MVEGAGKSRTKESQPDLSESESTATGEKKTKSVIRRRGEETYIQ